ncbi:hypothetical protein IPF37_05960 [bacterium]|nr:MAG: hypothetical protein IPF37_05960 [bacterium]
MKILLAEYIINQSWTEVLLFLKYSDSDYCIYGKSWDLKKAAASCFKLET